MAIVGDDEWTKVSTRRRRNNSPALESSSEEQQVAVCCGCVPLPALEGMPPPHSWVVVPGHPFRRTARPAISKFTVTISNNKCCKNGRFSLCKKKKNLLSKLALNILLKVY